MSQGWKECNQRPQLCTSTAGMNLSWVGHCSRLEDDGMLIPEFSISLPGKELAGSKRSLLNHRCFIIKRTPGETKQRMRNRSSKHLSGL